MGCPHKEAVMEYTVGKHEARGGRAADDEETPSCHVFSSIHKSKTTPTETM